MKNIQTFDEFLKESQLNEAYRGDYSKVVNKVYTKASNGGYEPYNEWENLSYALKSAGFDPKITLVKLVKDPKFKDLDQNYQDDIIKITGVKGGKHSEFTKEFINAVKSYGKGILTGRYDDEENAIYAAAALQKSLDDKNDNDLISSLYNGIDYGVRKQLQAKYGSSIYDILKEMSPEEIEFIVKFSKPTAEYFIKNHFNDVNISRWLESTIADKFNTSGHGTKSEEYYFSGTSWAQPAMSKPLEFVKEIIMSGMDIKWDKFKVERKMLDAKHSPVVSSSFSTTYYYDVKLEINGKKFDLPKVVGGSDHYSGGWN